MSFYFPFGLEPIVEFLSGLPTAFLEQLICSPVNEFRDESGNKSAGINAVSHRGKFSVAVAGVHIEGGRKFLRSGGTSNSAFSLIVCFDHPKEFVDPAGHAGK